jgi:Protein of unknown function (DUF2889)
VDAIRSIPELALAGKGGGHAPVRRPGSARRTTSIDVHWPEGKQHPAAFLAMSRDASTGQDGMLHVIDAQTVSGRSTLNREILAISCQTSKDSLDSLIGRRAGGQLRAALRELHPTAAAQASGLYQLLDDLAGATLVSTWAWFAWDGYSGGLANRIREAEISGSQGSMRGVCIGLRDGSSALDASGFPVIGEQYSAQVPTLVNPDDPQGWHELPAPGGPSMRRARWIDITRDGTKLVVETGFQDNALRQDGEREAIHEYRADAVIDLATATIEAISATPYILPHGECPAAVLNLARLRGQSIDDIRSAVPRLLGKEDGCTHLNDVVRALFAVPHLSRHIPE